MMNSVYSIKNYILSHQDGGMFLIGNKTNSDDEWQDGLVLAQRELLKQNKQLLFSSLPGLTMICNASEEFCIEKLKELDEIGK